VRRVARASSVAMGANARPVPWSLNQSPIPFAPHHARSFRAHCTALARQASADHRHMHCIAPTHAVGRRF
jgi:hypothetical protein